MDRLRSPGGCPWDARQTHESLVPYLLEEAYETVEAIEAGDREHLQEELGDLLLQVVFHARLGQEDAQRPWDVDDVAAGIVAKLVRRHPHVFGDADARTPEQVERRWEELKAAEKERASATDGIPPALPALSLAAAVLGRAARAGLAVPLPATAAGPPAADMVAAAGSPDDLGAALLVVVAAARDRGWDAEQVLRAAVRRHVADLRAVEGLPPAGDPPAGAGDRPASLG